MVSPHGSQEYNIHCIFLGTSGYSKVCYKVGRAFTGTQNGLLLLPSCWGFSFLGWFPGHPLMEEEGALHGSGSSLRPRTIAFILRSSLLSAFKCYFMQVAFKEAAYKRYGCPWTAVLQQILELLSPWERNLLHFARYTSNYSQKGPVCSVSIGQCQYYVDFLAGQPMPELKGLCSYQACSGRPSGINTFSKCKASYWLP